MSIYNLLSYSNNGETHVDAGTLKQGASSAVRTSVETTDTNQLINCKIFFDCCISDGVAACVFRQ